MRGLETHLFGLTFETWLRSVGHDYSRVNFFIVADSASSNVKLTWKLLSWLKTQGEHLNVLVTSHYAPCLIHQMARILTMNLERQQVTFVLHYSPSSEFQPAA